MTTPSKNNKNYTVERVKRSLEKKGVRIDNMDIVLIGAKNLGIKSWGMVDFLRYHEKYYLTGLGVYGKGYQTVEKKAE